MRRALHARTRHRHVFTIQMLWSGALLARYWLRMHGYALANVLCDAYDRPDIVRVSG